MDIGQEIDLLRLRIDALERLLGALENDSAGAVPGMLVQFTAETAYPSGGPKVYAARPVRISGTRAEGAAVTLTPQTGVYVYVAHLPNDTPASGSYALVSAAGDFWTDA